MALVKERKPVVLPEHKNRNPEHKNSEEIIIKPPQPFMTVIYKNGRGNRIEEEVILSTFAQSGIVQKIRKEIKALDKRLARIPSLIKEIPKKKRKHGGRLVPKDEKTQRQERLAKEMISIPDKKTHREGLIKKLETILISSNPFDPLQLKYARARIKIKEGEPLSEEDQEFWQYMREKAPEIYRHIGSGQTELFEIIRGLFIRRLNWHRATKERKNEADNEFYRFINSITDETYDQIKGDLIKITEHFTETLKP